MYLMSMAPWLVSCKSATTRAHPMLVKVLSILLSLSFSLLTTAYKLKEQISGREIYLCRHRHGREVP